MVKTMAKTKELRGAFENGANYGSRHRPNQTDIALEAMRRFPPKEKLVFHEIVFKDRKAAPLTSRFRFKGGVIEYNDVVAGAFDHERYWKVWLPAEDTKALMGLFAEPFHTEIVDE